jgi:hypothetical protein
VGYLYIYFFESKILYLVMYIIPRWAALIRANQLLIVIGTSAFSSTMIDDRAKGCKIEFLCSNWPRCTRLYARCADHSKDESARRCDSGQLTVFGRRKSGF